MLMRTFLGCILLLLTTNSALAGQFLRPVVYRLQDHPFHISAGDVNGDGFMDLVTSGAGIGKYSILLGNGDGSFRRGLRLSGDNGPLVLVDLNRDGKLDLVSCVSVSLGNGDGTFQPPTNYASGGISITMSDFNKDGNPDIAISTGTDLQVWLGNGDGSLQSPIDIAAGPYPAIVDVADLNADGIPDMVVNDAIDHSFGVFIGQGDGTFDPPVFYFIVGFPDIFTLGDFNNDGKPDLVTRGNPGEVVFLPGNGDGTFGQMITSTIRTGVPGLIGAGDINHDGNLDAVFRDNQSGIQTMIGAGDGSFSDPPRYPVNANVEYGLVKDLNGDGWDDIVVLDKDSTKLEVLINVGR